MKKRILVAAVCFILSVMCLCGAAGCITDNGAPKTFTKEGMNITLTEDFNEVVNNKFTAYYQGKISAVMATKEKFSMLAGMEDYSLDKYTGITISVNGLKCEAFDREGKDYKYFTYENNVDGLDFYYLATTFKADDAFWLIQFGCLNSKKDKYTERFLSWADTVTFGDDALQEIE